MGFLDNYKITSAEIAQNKVQSAPDTLTGTAQDNKKVFDNLAELVANKVNAVIEKIGSDQNDTNNTMQGTNYAITDSDLKSIFGSSATLKSILQALSKSDYAQGIVGKEAGYTDVYGSIGLVSDVIGGSGITHSSGSFTIVDTAIKAVRITAGGRYVPADGASTYVGFNRVSKNGTPVLYEAIGYCTGGASAMWQISGIVPATQGDVFILQGKGNVSGKVRRSVGTNLSLEAIYV